MAEDNQNSTTQNPSSWASSTHQFFQSVGTFGSIMPQSSSLKGLAYPDLIRELLKLHRIDRGRITSSLSVKPAFLNSFGSLHGGAVASIAQAIAEACARTVVAEDKEMFLGELATSYLSPARVNDEVEVEGVVVRSGRNVTVTSIEFRKKGTKQLLYTARATFYNTPVAKL
ncbi:hypothetical protein Syun_012866 [Stephania yunnanensis]|uniref:Thioesterase domain-containing protein n=1 Tax=Stephania yunnanensis TaxID=152371 RepID=A0AAP0K0A7_9MAGN